MGWISEDRAKRMETGFYCKFDGLSICRKGRLSRCVKEYHFL
jgi:hypothetical protein